MKKRSRPERAIKALFLHPDDPQVQQRAQRAVAKIIGVPPTECAEAIQTVVALVKDMGPDAAADELLRTSGLIDLDA